jgi:small subunit ribosomal protein S15
LKENNLSPSVPEDLDALLRKATKLRAHLDRNRSDAYNRRAIQVTESKIHSLSNYYKSKGVLPEDWKYAPAAHP